MKRFLCLWCLLWRQAKSLPVIVPVPAPVSVPTSVIAPVPAPPPNVVTTGCYDLCSFFSGGSSNASVLDSLSPIATGSSTTCGDVENLLPTLNPTSCSFLAATDLPLRCGCPRPLPACSICLNANEVLTNPFEPLNLNQTSLSPNISSQYNNCDNIDISVNSITPDVCNQLHQIGISKRCGCTLFPAGPSSCDTAETLTLGETISSRITNNTMGTMPSSYPDPHCAFDSPSVWFRFEGTGGHLSVDTCASVDAFFGTKLSVYTGTSCGSLTCLSRYNFFSCGFTFRSKVNTTYFANVGGYYGDIGSFNLSLTDATFSPTVTPSTFSPTVTSTARPTAPTISPTSSPSFKPFLTPPSASPTQYPTAAVFPECNICGSSEQRVSLPSASIGPVAGYSCLDLEFNGLTGQIEPSACVILSELNLFETCGCITPLGNDVCTGAITVSVGQTLNGTTINATWDNEQICPYDNYYSAGVWYRFVGTGGPMKVDTCKYSDFNVELSVFTGSDCSSLKCIATSSGFCGMGTRVKLDTIKGEAYYVLVHGSNPGNFELEVADVVPPANDLCTNAASIQAGQTLIGTTNDATPDGLPSCGDDRNNTSTPGVWYRFKSSGQPVRIVADTCGEGTSFDTAISVFTGSCSKLECIAGNDNACYLSSRVVWESESVTDYFILVHGPASSLVSNDFQLALTVVAATPTVSPAPSFVYHPCICGEAIVVCFCSGASSTGGAGAASPVSLPNGPSPAGLTLPPPYSAPFVATTSLPPPSPQFVSTSMPSAQQVNRLPSRSPLYVSSPITTSPTIPHFNQLSFSYAMPVYTSGKPKQNKLAAKGKSLKVSKKDGREKKGGKDSAAKYKG